MFISTTNSVSDYTSNNNGSAGLLVVMIEVSLPFPT